jgi:hypothetical protein
MIPGRPGSSRWKVRRQFHIIFAALLVAVRADHFLEALSQPNTGAPAVLVDELDRTTFDVVPIGRQVICRDRRRASVLIFDFVTVFESEPLHLFHFPP